MIVIKEEDFRLTQDSNSSMFWNLELLTVIRPKNKEARKEFKQCGYGLTLEHAIKKIINYKIASRHQNESITFKAYLKDYKTLVSQITKCLDSEINTVNNTKTIKS